MSLLIYNDRGLFVTPFKRVVIRSKVVCRFCQAKADERTDVRMRKAGLDYNPDTDTLRRCQKMPIGTEAIQMITSGGPTGTAYICIPCARELFENLRAEIRGKCK